MGYWKERLMEAQDKRRERAANRRHKSDQRVIWQGFISRELTGKEAEELAGEIQAWTVEIERLLLWAEAGLRISVGLDAVNECFVASLTDNEPASETAGWTLTGRGSTAERALACLNYKHTYLFAEGWLIVPTTSRLDVQ